MRSGHFFTSYAANTALFRTPLERRRMGLFAVLVIVFPFVATSYGLSLANQIAIATVGAIGLNILVGYTGQISLGQGAFMAVGAYASGLATIEWGLPFWLSIPIASFFTAAVGVFFGLPSLRLKGLYLAVATLAAQQIVEWIVTHWTGLTGGTEALVVPAPRLFGARMNTDFRFYWFALAAASGTALFAANLFRSRVGRAFLAIRDQDIAAEASGVNLFRYKLTAFAVSSFFVGMSGALRDLARGARRCLRAHRFARAHPRAPWPRQALVEREDLFSAMAVFLLAWLVPADDIAAPTLLWRIENDRADFRKGARQRK